MTIAQRREFTAVDVDSVTRMLAEASSTLTIISDYVDAQHFPTAAAASEAIGGVKTLVEAARDLLV